MKKYVLGPLEAALKEWRASVKPIPNCDDPSLPGWLSQPDAMLAKAIDAYFGTDEEPRDTAELLARIIADGDHAEFISRLEALEKVAHAPFDFTSLVRRIENIEAATGLRESCGVSQNMAAESFGLRVLSIVQRAIQDRTMHR